MRRALLSSIDVKWLFTIGIIFTQVFCPAPASAEDHAQPGLPILFDSRERLPKPDLSQLVRLRFLTTTDFPPFSFADQSGKLSGFDVDLVREVCDELGVADKCQIQALPFADLQDALATSQGDAVIAGIAVTPQLRQRFAFSRPYLQLPARFARNLKAPITGTTASALAGHPVGVVKDTAHEAMLAAFFPAIKRIPFDDKQALLTALKDGKIDAAFADSLQLTFWVSSAAPEKCCALFDGPYLSQQFLGEGMTIMLRQQDSDLTAAINHALATLSHNGRLQEIYLRYFPYGLY